MNLIEESDVEREAELVSQGDLLRQLETQFARCSCRVGQQGLCVSVHECDRQHQRFLRLRCLLIISGKWKEMLS